MLGDTVDQIIAERDEVDALLKEEYKNLRKANSTSWKAGESGNPWGRSPGATARAIKERLQELDFDCVEKMVELATNSKHDRDRIEATEYLMSRVYPKLKSVEITGDIGTTFQLNIVKAGDREAKAVLEHDSKDAS